MLAGFSQTGDSDGRWPLVMASPHSGRDYPAAFLAGSRLSLAQLRRAEDAFVDELLDDVAGVPVLRARYARTWLDLNRGEDELDPLIIDDVPASAARLNDRVTAGLGVLPRVAAQGLEIYKRRLARAEAEARLATVHRPWHRRLSALLARARDRHGYAILIDCHSMPRPAGVMPPQIVLGDRHGTSASAALVLLIERHFASAGWRVARNTPYAGGYTTVLHGKPADGIHAVQIEIDRGLYMEANRLVKHDGFALVAQQLGALAPLLVAAAPLLGLAPPLREAAE